MPHSEYKDSKFLRLGLTWGLGVLSAFLIFRHLLLVNPEATLWGDDFDPKLLRWTAEWGYYALGRRFSWSLFWDAQSFYPHTNTLAYSDCLLTLQLVYTPLRWLGVMPLTALYLSLAIFCVLTFVLSVWLLRKLQLFDFVECLIIAFAAHFSLSMINFLPHYQLFGFQFAPPFLISLYIFCSNLELRWLILSLSLFVFGSSFAIYLAPTLFCLGLLVALALLPQRLLRRRASEASRLLIIWSLVSLIFAGVFYLLVMRHYTAMVSETAVQTFEESAIYSASPQSLIIGRTINSKWYKPEGSAYSKYGDWERAYFPGWILLIGGLCGVMSLMRRFGCTKEGELRRFCCVIFSLGVFALVLSWGPFLEGVKMPFYYLAHILPGVRNIRAPGRFGFILGLPLGVLLTVGLRSLFRLEPFTRRNQLAQGVGLFLLIFESLPSYRTFDYVVPYQDEAKKLSEYITPGTPVIELPAHGASHFDTIHIILTQLNEALYHHGKLFLGYGGRTTEECQTLINKSQRLSAGSDGAFQETLAYAKSFGVGAIFIHLDKYPTEIKTQFSPENLEKNGYKQVYLSDKALIAIAQQVK